MAPGSQCQRVGNLLSRRAGWVRYESLQQPRLRGPYLEEHAARYAPGSEPQGKRDHNDVIERPDDREKFGNQVDG